MVERDTLKTPNRYIDSAGTRWAVLGKTFPRDEINLPRDERHYSFLISRPGVGGFIHELISEETFDKSIK